MLKFGAKSKDSCKSIGKRSYAKWGTIPDDKDYQGQLVNGKRDGRGIVISKYTMEIAHFKNG